MFVLVGLKSGVLGVGPGRIVTLRVERVLVSPGDAGAKLFQKWIGYVRARSGPGCGAGAGAYGCWTLAPAWWCDVAWHASIGSWFELGETQAIKTHRREASRSG